MTIIQKIGGRKFMVLLISITIFSVSLAYVLIADTNDKAGIIVSIATGLSMICGTYFAGNVAQKNKIGD